MWVIIKLDPVLKLTIRLLSFRQDSQVLTAASTAGAAAECKEKE